MHIWTTLIGFMVIMGEKRHQIRREMGWEHKESWREVVVDGGDQCTLYQCLKLGVWMLQPEGGVIWRERRWLIPSDQKGVRERGREEVINTN